MEHSYPERNLVDKATEEVDAMFRGGNFWDNNSALPSASLMMSISCGASLMTT